MFIFSIFIMFVSFSVGVQCSLVEGQIYTALVTNVDDSSWRTLTRLDRLICDYIMTCDESYLNLCHSLLLSYIIVRLLIRMLNILDHYLLSVLSDTKTAKMSRDLFIHVLSLDKRFFDETRNIDSYMNVNAMHTLLFTVIPEIITSSFRFLVVSYYLVTMDLYLGLFSIFYNLFLNIIVMSFFVRRDLDLLKRNWQMNRVHGQISGDTLSMIRTVKLFAKEKYHIKEYDEWFSELLRNMKSGAGWRYIQEILDDSLDLFVYVGMIYFGYIRYRELDSMTSSDFTGFMILHGQLYGLFSTVRDDLKWVVQEFHDIERYNTLKETKPRMQEGKSKPKDIKGIRYDMILDLFECMVIYVYRVKQDARHIN